MPKVRNKFYAVKIGRGGPAIYTTWDECKAKTERFPGAVHKSFTSKSQAEAWLRVPEHRVYMRDPEELTQDEEDLLWQQFPRCATEEPPEFIESGPSVAGISARTEEEDFIRLDEAMDTIPPPPPREVPLVLSPEQMMVLAKVKQGGSVFFTGHG
ncbi:hypothetical protein JAAARDRAFT_351315 [Jaapia argillacea MUCL 33604]|uniref:Ribonuclease H1 N-terminal domain-containing protein n=1 Tax=Jaapia argillacea MUCL 33604 TaxID=933084 RepID=A0A067PJ45_9AGAM|nr:hypothetical protein JAAARDRAFT_351315 [Jaapia argillacea MUCL 33604]